MLSLNSHEVIVMVESWMQSPAPCCAHELVGWLEEKAREKVTPPQHPPTPTTSFATYTALQCIGVRDEKGWGFWVGWGVGEQRWRTWYTRLGAS